MIMCNAFRGNAMDLRAEISFRLFQFARSVVVQFFFFLDIEMIWNRI